MYSTGQGWYGNELTLNGVTYEGPSSTWSSMELSLGPGCYDIVSDCGTGYYGLNVCPYRQYQMSWRLDEVGGETVLEGGSPFYGQFCVGGATAPEEEEEVEDEVVSIV